MKGAYYLNQFKLRLKLCALTSDEVKLVLVIGSIVDILHKQRFPLLTLCNLSAHTSKVLYEEFSSLGDEDKRFLGDHLALIVHVDDRPDAVHWQLHEFTYSQ